MPFTTRDSSSFHCTEIHSLFCSLPGKTTPVHDSHNAAPSAGVRHVTDEMDTGRGCFFDADHSPFKGGAAGRVSGRTAKRGGPTPTSWHHRDCRSHSHRTSTGW
ncbi:hypothetical protein E2C01_091091 [Portunus trituberculatus]|uniref:Uncharacterized protein n=1 Tax=Portunus trituberculatus TaxID=210409 RepID=A0A5B7JI94_PORTR|nr:hypothetical protein [Portunus trituberculatus]